LINVYNELPVNLCKLSLIYVESSLLYTYHTYLYLLKCYKMVYILTVLVKHCYIWPVWYGDHYGGVVANVL